MDDDESHRRCHSPGPSTSPSPHAGLGGTDSDNERPLSSNQLNSIHSNSQSVGSISAGSPSPGTRTPRNPNNSPSNSRNTDSPIEVGGPISLTTRSSNSTSTSSTTNTTPTTTTLNTTVPQFNTHIFGSFGSTNLSTGGGNGNNET
uniref:Uncharacterized protein n=1 Tax=Glossina brevipalpis TaxID=37001 RepID=A0A1A9WUS6_9MUSC